MRRFLASTVCFTGLVAAAPAPIFAQAPKAEAPATALVPAPFRSFIVADPRTDDKTDARNRSNKMHCLITEQGLNPAILIFTRSTPEKADAPTAKLILATNDLAVKYRPDRLGVMTFFLTLTKEYPEDEKRDATAKPVDDLARQLKTDVAKQLDETKLTPTPKPLLVPFGLAAGASEQTKAYDLKDGHDVTVIFYHRMKVLNTWTFSAEKPPSDADLKTLTDTVNAELKK
ncbi:MAG: hypothetical protein ACRCZF_10195 [Gemmataceae bacterium]